MSKYDKAYFIAKFEAIPEDKWSCGSRACAMAHTDRRNMYGYVSEYTPEAQALIRLFAHHSTPNDPGEEFGVFNVNDGVVKAYKQPTPKARILAALRDLP